MLLFAAVMALLTSSRASAGSLGDAGLGLARAGGVAAAAGASSNAPPANSSSSGSSGLLGGFDFLAPWQRLWSAPNQRASKPKAQVLAELKEENAWKNSLVTWMLPQAVLERMPFVVQTWFRCWVMCMALYFGVGALWAYYAYYAFGSQLFKPGDIPAGEDIWEQIKVSFRGMPLYAMLPTLTEYCVEQGWTLAYTRVGDVGLKWYLAYFVLYMTSVEFFVYWQHRILHMGVGYRWLHVIHHKYNKGDQMSPFAGLAFHPLDGIMQALPYSWTLFYVPMHFLTHELLLFFTSIWTTNIHDNLHAKIAPVMGAGYHTIHHTLYNYNYGHYFTFVDRLFGTLITPEENEARRAAARKEAEQRLKGE